MGRVFPGIHPTAALYLRDTLGLKVLVETGTYKGATVAWALNRFEKVISIEISPGFFAEVSARLTAPNLQLILGDSRERLSNVCIDLTDTPALFWLDAHWTGEKEYLDPKGKLPLIEEINAINDYHFGKNAIMVDDYSLWVSPIKDQVFDLLHDDINTKREIAVMDDIVIACSEMPPAYKDCLYERIWRKAH